MRAFPLAALLLAFTLAHEASSADARGGRVVWWGLPFGRRPDGGGTNGVVLWQDEVMTDVVDVASGGLGTLLLRNNGEAFGWRATLNEPCGPLLLDGQPLTNVAALRGAVAFRRDGTVVHCDPWSRRAEVLPALTNVIAVAGVANGRLLAVRKDGTLLCQISATEWDDLGNEPNSRRTPVASAGGRPFTNVVALIEAPGRWGGDCLALKSDGTLWAVLLDPGDMGLADFSGPDHPVTVHQVAVDGDVLTNIVAVTCWAQHSVALKNDGTVLAWDESGHREPLPPGLHNLVAISSGGDFGLKRDGTVVTWGSYTNVPAGLNGVIAIAAGMGSYVAVTTNAVLPSSVYIPPMGRLEEMEREADLIFKGQVMATTPRTNSSFPDWGKPHATAFRLISVLKGHPKADELTFWHNTSGPSAWGGGSPPSWHQFEVGKAYLVFADKLDKPGYLYTPPPDATNRLKEFRQLDNNGVTRTLDARPAALNRVKDLHWFELTLMLTNGRPADAVYAIQRLNWLSPRCGQRWGHTKDFRRPTVLNAMVMLLTNRDESVAKAAIDCFRLSGIVEELQGEQEVGALLPSVPAPECVDQLRPYAAPLLAVADGNFSSARRAAVLRVFAGTKLPLLVDWLPKWVKDPAEAVRSECLSLVADFPGTLSEPALLECAKDPSPRVRAATADAIGAGKFAQLLPTLVHLFCDPVGRRQPLPPLTLEELESGSHYVGGGYVVDDANWPVANNGDVHTSVGYALLQFDVEQVGGILKTNLSDKGFRLSFIRKLATSGVETNLPLLATALKERTAGSEQEAAKNGFHWDLSHLLRGNYGWAWDTLFGHVSAQTREDLTAPHMAPLLDALQIADDPGDPRTRSLYGFFLDKGMLERAITLRRGIIRRTEDKAIDKKSFNFPALLKAFDELDEKHSLKPGLNVVSPDS